MLCFPCAEQCIDRPAVALCRVCTAGLCLDHLRETASRSAAGHVLDGCQHDTWNVGETPAPAPRGPGNRAPTRSAP